MAGENVIDYLYPEDPTGQAASNKVVDEYHTLTPPTDPLDFHFIIPDVTPFFLDSVILTHVQSGRTLVRGIDWAPGQRFDSASFELKNVRGGVYASILFFDRTLNGQVRLNEYQTLGGGWTLNENKILEILSAREYDPRTLTYEEVSGKPDVFPPVDHDHDVGDDLIGMAEVVEAIHGVAEAIRTKPQDPSGGGGYSDEDIDGLFSAMDERVNSLESDKLGKTETAVDSNKVYGLSKPQLIGEVAAAVLSGPGSLVIEVESDITAALGSAYFIKEHCTITLPSISGVTENKTITFHKAVGINAIIVKDPTDQTSIVLNGVSDTSLLYDVNRPITLMFDASEGVWVI